MPKLSPTPPDLDTQAGRLAWARINAGYSSPREAAGAKGWNENTYKSHENGIRGSEGIKPKHLKKYARAYGVSEVWLTLGSGPALMSPEDAAWAELSLEERETALRLLDVARHRG